MTKISFVYFDVGGVVIKDFSDTPKMDQMLEDMGVPHNLRAEALNYYRQFDDEYCLGKKHVDSLIPYFRDNFNSNLKNSFSMLEYFVDHFEPNEGIWSIITKIQQKTKIGLLTDQYLNMLSRVENKGLMPPVKWHAIIDSTEVKYRKPMPEIYQIAKERAGVSAEEILFIDNRQKNLDVPAKMGWQTYLYDSSDYAKSNQALAEFVSLNL